MARWVKGQCGNPKGRAKGSRNKATLAAEALMHNDAKRITRKCIEMAREGDPVAIRIVMDRIAPPRKDHFVAVTIPELKTAADAVTATAKVIQAVSDGKLTPGEAEELTKLITAFSETVHVADLAKRIEEFERREEEREAARRGLA